MITQTVTQEETRLTEFEKVSLKVYWEVIEKYMHYKSTKRLIGKDQIRVLKYADGYGKWENLDTDMRSWVRKDYNHIANSSDLAVINMAREILEIVKERISKQSKKKVA